MHEFVSEAALAKSQALPISKRKRGACLRRAAPHTETEVPYDSQRSSNFGNRTRRGRSCVVSAGLIRKRGHGRASPGVRCPPLCRARLCPPLRASLRLPARASLRLLARPSLRLRLRLQSRRGRGRHSPRRRRLSLPDYAATSASFSKRYGIGAVLSATNARRGIMVLRSYRRLNRYSNSARYRGTCFSRTAR